MPGHYEDKKKKKKRKATPFDGVAKHGMTEAFKKLTAPKSLKPKPPKPPKPPSLQNRRTGEDYLDMESRRKRKKK